MTVSIPLYTVDDLDHFPDDGNRYELLDGVLLVTPLAAHVHQVIASRLIAGLTIAIGSEVLARVVGPGVVSRPPRTQLEPDVLVYPARFPASSPWTAITEHWLAVETYRRCGSWTQTSGQSKFLARTVSSRRTAIGSSGRFPEPIAQS